MELGGTRSRKSARHAFPVTSAQPCTKPFQGYPGIKIKERQGLQFQHILFVQSDSGSRGVGSILDRQIHSLPSRPCLSNGPACTKTSRLAFRGAFPPATTHHDAVPAKFGGKNHSQDRYCPGKKEEPMAMGKSCVYLGPGSLQVLHLDPPWMPPERHIDC